MAHLRFGHHRHLCVVEPKRSHSSDYLNCNCSLGIHCASCSLVGSVFTNHSFTNVTSAWTGYWIPDCYRHFSFWHNLPGDVLDYARPGSFPLSRTKRAVVVD